MRRIFNEVSKDFDLPKSAIVEIWDSQFKFIAKSMKENYCNELAPSIRLAGLGTFKVNPFRIKKFKENYDKKYRPQKPPSGVTKIDD